MAVSIDVTILAGGYAYTLKSPLPSVWCNNMPFFCEIVEGVPTMCTTGTYSLKEPAIPRSMHIRERQAYQELAVVRDVTIQGRKLSNSKGRDNSRDAFDPCITICSVCSIQLIDVAHPR